MRPARVTLCDTTLRDGEQAPGVAFSPERKLRLARLLDAAGVGEIEAGTPVSGGAEFEGVKRVAGAGLSARVVAWCRARPEDVHAAESTGAGAVAIAIPSSRAHLSARFGKDVRWACERLARMVYLAGRLGLMSIAALEDASNAEREDLAQLIAAGRGAGAERIRISDTVSALDPFAALELVSFAAGEARGPVEFHGHNDFGLATANALAAARGGATHLSVTVLGIGERAGNAPLEEVALALSKLIGIDAGVRLTALHELFREVSTATGRFISPGKPVAGSAVFTHESGIHVDGVLKEPSTYEPFDPALIGASRKIALGKHSGRRAVAYKLERMGVATDADRLAALAARVREEAARMGRGVCDSELLAMVGEGGNV